MAVITKDTFDPLRRYVGVRLQQGVPIVDADWNEMEDVRRFELRAFLKWFVGNGVPNGTNGFGLALQNIPDDFLIVSGISGSPNGLSNIGRALVNGLDVLIDNDLRYSLQRLHVSQDPQGKLAAQWGVPPVPILPASPQPLLVYLDVWERLVTPTEDPSLVHSGLQVESCARMKREWVVRVRPQASLPAPGDGTTDFIAGHSYLALASIVHTVAGAVVTSVQDLRLRVNSLQSLYDGSASALLRSLTVQGPLNVRGGSWDVTNSEGDLRIGNETLRLKVGVALSGGGAGDVRVRAQGGTNRMMLGGGNNDTFTVTATGVGINNIAPNAPLSFGSSIGNTKLALWENGTSDVYGMGIQSAQFRLHIGNPGARFTFLDAPNGNEMMQLHGNNGNGSFIDIGYPNPIRFSSTHTGFSNNTTNQSEITSDVGNYKTLMIIGNKSAGLKDANGAVVRRVSIWDRLEVNGSLSATTGAVMNSITAGVIPAWLTDTNAEGYKWPYECIGVNHGSHNLRLISPNGVYVHAKGGFFANAPKNFCIPHPLDREKKYLVHSCLEGPEVGVYYRGEARLQNGEAVIELPTYFEALTRQEGRTVQLTPIWEGRGHPCSQVVTSPVRDGRFTVYATDDKNPSQAFYWEVKAIRSDVPPLVIEPLKTELDRAIS